MTWLALDICWFVGNGLLGLGYFGLHLACYCVLLMLLFWFMVVLAYLPRFSWYFVVSSFLKSLFEE